MASQPDAHKTACSVLSREAGEPLPGTATLTQFFLLLEHHGPWGARAFEESDIPEAVKTHLSGAVKSISGARLQLIKTRAHQPTSGIAFFLAAARPESPALYEFHVEDYVELLTLDIQAVLSSQTQRQHEAPLYLVCTNGRRDPCCAREGPAVFQVLLDGLPASNTSTAWETTHIGGHRLAANLLCLPEGLLYGRVSPADVPLILAVHQQGRLHLPKLRGRCAYPAPVQAAEYFLYRHTGESRVEAFRFLDSVEIEPGRWLIRFRERKSDTTYEVEVSRQERETPVYESCAMEKVILPKQYTLAQVRETTGSQ